MPKLKKPASGAGWLWCVEQLGPRIAAAVIAMALSIASATEAEARLIVIEPDTWTAGTNISNPVEGVTLSAQGDDSSDKLVYAVTAFDPPTGELSFGWQGEFGGGTYFDDHWGRDNSQALRADFTSFLAQEVSIDYFTDLGAVTIEAFAVGGASLGTVSASAGSGTLTYKAAANEIASVEFTIEGNGGADFGVLDHMVIRILEPGTIVIEPDTWTAGTNISNLVAGVTLSAQGGSTSDNLVYAVTAFEPPTGERSFGWFDEPFFDDHWGRPISPALRADLTGFLAREVSIDYMTDLGAVTIEAFAAGGGSLGTVSAGPGSGTLTYVAAASEIASVEFTIEGFGGADFGVLDHMVIRNPDPSTIIVEPDASTEGADISNLVPGVTLSAQGGDTSDNLVYAVTAFDPPTGERSFGWFDEPFFDDHWGRPGSPALRAEFTGFLAQEVSIDYMTDLGAVTIEAFAVGGGSLGTVSADPGTGTLTYLAATNEIDSVELSIEGFGGADFGVLDHMVIRVPEPGRVGLALAAFAALGMLRRSRRC